MIRHQLTIPLITVLVFVLQVQAEAHNSTTPCSPSCGKGKSAIRLSYPFGFSDGCPIKLTCSSSKTNNSARIGEFMVLNVTRSSLLVQLPAKCNRSIDSIYPLFGPYYGPAWSNGFLLQQCPEPLNGCLIPTSFVESRFQGLGNCSSGSRNISCFSQEKKDRVDLLSESTLKGTGCKSLVSSIAAVGPDMNSLEFQSLELRWWLNGSCDPSNCSANATCQNVSLADGKLGFQCHCNDGFEGDGFFAGDGCWRGESARWFQYSPSFTVHWPVKISLFSLKNYALIPTIVGVFCFSIIAFSLMKISPYTIYLFVILHPPMIHQTLSLKLRLVISHRNRKLRKTKMKEASFMKRRKGWGVDWSLLITLGANLKFYFLQYYIACAIVIVIVYFSGIRWMA